MKLSRKPYLFEVLICWFLQMIGLFIMFGAASMAFVNWKIFSLGGFLLFSSTLKFGVATNKRLQDVFPHKDAIMLNGLFWILHIFTVGLALVILMILPGKKYE